MDIDSLYSIYRQHPVICTDSRQILPNSIFFALRGERFNGNEFAAQALEKGAAYAVVDQTLQTHHRFIKVPDVLKCLQQLARYHREHIDIPVIAIAGSNGKTTTKELVSAVLSSHYPCHFTKGNLNNHIGVPLTLLAMPANCEVAVLELGANRPGEIAELCAIARPTHGLLTNIGKEHLEGFGSLQGVKKAEGELYQYLSRHNGVVFLNLSEKYLPAMAKKVTKKVSYRQAHSLDANDVILDVQLLAETPFIQAAFLSDDLEKINVQSNLIGRHNFFNIMTAIALGIYFRVPAEKIKAAVEGYVPANNRSQVIRQGSNLILLDAYNANPSSMKPALETLRSLDFPHKIAILGDMLEMGEAAAAEHARLLRFAKSLKLDQLVLVGPEFGRLEGIPTAKLRHFADAAAARAWWQSLSLEHTAVLIKGSRGIRLESVLSETP